MRHFDVWFKKMLAYGLSLCALIALPTLVLYMALNVSISVMPNSLGGFIVMAGMGGSAIPALAGVMITYLGFSMIIKLPAQIEETLTGVKKRK